jgi:hypothetical protein
MIADILAAHWPAYAAKFGRLIPDEQRAAVRAILRCRTPALGGSHYRCACGREQFAYHSCNHRACPRCGRDDAARWLEQQRARLLPVPYFLVTLTVPEALREPIRAAMQPWYGALLKEGARALQDLLAADKHLGAEAGITALLQSWTRDLRYHPHVHLLVPGGGLTPNQLRWVRVQEAQFLVPQVKLASHFKGRLKAWLQADKPDRFKAVPAKVWWVKWVADVQPVGSGEAALKYLANYLCKPPLHDTQIEHWNEEQVTFRYRDNAGAQRHCTVSGNEFVRRFLEHVLPKGFQRVRHYGWLAAAAKKKRERIQALLDWKGPPPPPSTFHPPAPQCPCCGKAMALIGTLPRSPPGPEEMLERLEWESFDALN